MFRTHTERRRASRIPVATGLVLLCLVLATSPLLASSHREAPGITTFPQLDATDFYMFRSYEPGREDYVTLIANYNPLQDPYGGPNYTTLNEEALYAIHIDNTGDGVEDISFQFQFTTFTQGLAVPVGDAVVPVPLRFIGPVGSGNYGAQNVIEAYDVALIRGPMGVPTGLTDATFNGGAIGVKPADHAGTKTFPDYEAYARDFVYDLEFGQPGCDGRVFVGQRKDSFVVNLGEIFDLINTNPVGPVDAESDDLADKNVTTLALEIPISCLRGEGDVIGGWTTSHLPRTTSLDADPDFRTLVGESSRDFVQVSRLGMPLVNEVVIGLPDKNRFNASHPKDDLANFATYVTNPSLPELLELLFGVEAPNNFPRTDLVTTFVTGIPTLNEFGIGEMQRLNLAIPPTPAAMQSNFGVAGGDLAGFPNGRRPGDDVVDVALRVAMGVLCHAFSAEVGCVPTDAPAGLLPYTDGAEQRPDQFDAAFPYLVTPLPGATQ